MFKSIFNLSYKRDLNEAIVFYFSYVTFALYLWILTICILFYIISDVELRFLLILIIIPFIPFIFYTCIAILLCIKKNYKDRNNIIFLIATMLLTLFIPGLTGNILGIILSPIPPEFTFWTFVEGIISGVILFSISELFLGCIPVAILTTRECLADQKVMRKMDKEILKQQKKVERLLLMEKLSIKDFPEQNNTSC